MKSKKGVLLVNLGSPDSPAVPDVRNYIEEFLSDPRVIDTPPLQRKAVLNFIILPRRPKRSAEAYEKVWTPQGSPLIVTTDRVAELLREKVELPIAVAMRYGKPSMESAIQELAAQGVNDLFLIPLYPHYAMSSYETVVAKAQEILATLSTPIDLTVQPPFYDDPDYIQALLTVAKPYLEKDYDHILFSYHGVPERHIKKADPSGCYCLTMKDCCNRPNPAHAFCYRAQCMATTRAFVREAAIDDDKFSVSFQSRLGRDPWLQPFTDVVLEELPSQDKKKLLIISPAFVADCLETIEELGMEGKEEFLRAGGKDYHLIPCLNDSEQWIDVLKKFVHAFEADEYQLKAV